MKPKKSKKRNRAAQDSTLINIRALKVRVKRLESTVKALCNIEKERWGKMVYQVVMEGKK